MSKDLENQIRKFLSRHWDQKSSLLLGYSGGPDSRVLLDLLLKIGVRPHLAHVDHGWREESWEEACRLKAEADAMGLSFHTVRLEKDPREDVARQKRLEFFRSLCQKFSFQAVLLGHQENDWAETALKRVLEGAHLAYLGGMKPVGAWEGMALWRPLLKVPRKAILDYVEKRELKVVWDRTNEDIAYLRARMRLEILPHLSASFGKEVEGNLALLGERAFELKRYLDRKTEDALLGREAGPWGWALPCPLKEPIEIRHLLQRLGIPFTRSILEGLVDALAKGSANQRFGKRFLADRGVFFYLEERPPSFAEAIAVREGVFYSGDWKVEIGAPGDSGFDWRDVFRGRFSFKAPLGSVLQMPPLEEGGERKKWSQRKIPAFLRPCLPHLYFEGKRISDLFTWDGKEGVSVRFSSFPKDSSSTS